MKTRASLRYFLTLSGSALLLASQAHAIDYWWDNNGDTAGFGTAAGTWAVPTTNTLSTDSTGATAPIASVTTIDGDLVNFGTATVGGGLAGGTINVDGTGIDYGPTTFRLARNMVFGSQNTGDISFDSINGGKVVLGNGNITNNSVDSDVIFNADLKAYTLAFRGNNDSNIILNGDYFENNTTLFNMNLQVNGTWTNALTKNLTFRNNATFQVSSSLDIVLGNHRTSGTGDGSNNSVITKDTSTTSTLRFAVGVAGVTSADNEFGGKYSIQAGTMQWAKRNALYSLQHEAAWTAANIQVGSTGVFAVNVGAADEFTTTDVTTLLTNLGGLNGTDATGFAAGSAIGLDTTNAAGGTFTVADLIADSTGTGGGAIGVRKLGTGELVLTNANTYTGATSIKVGTLALGPLASINNSANISIAAGATLDVSQQASPYTLSASTTLSASGTSATAGTWAQIIGPAGGSVSLGAQSVTLIWAGDTSGTDTDSPALVLSQGELTLDNNAITINGSTLGLGTYRLIQVGDGATGTLNENGTPSYTVSGTAIDGTKTNVISSDGSGNLILTVTPGGGSAYDTWKAANAPGSNPDDDTDGDGVTNAVEFVLGGTSATNDLDKLPTTATDGTNMTFTFKRKQSSIDPKTSVAIEVGTDLVTWTTPPSPYTVPDGVTAGPPLTVVKGVPADYDTVTLTVAQDSAKKFARLKVVITP